MFMAQNFPFGEVRESLEKSSMTATALCDCRAIVPLDFSMNATAGGSHKPLNYRSRDSVTISRISASTETGLTIFSLSGMSLGKFPFDRSREAEFIEQASVMVVMPDR
jgi:hypothetical protein